MVTDSLVIAIIDILADILIISFPALLRVLVGGHLILIGIVLLLLNLGMF